MEPNEAVLDRNYRLLTVPEETEVGFYPIYPATGLFRATRLDIRGIFVLQTGRMVQILFLTFPLIRGTEEEILPRQAKYILQIAII